MRFQIFSRSRSRISVTCGHSCRLWAAFLADWLCDATSALLIRHHNLCFIRAISHSGFNNYIFGHCRRDHFTCAIAVDFFCVLTASLAFAF